MEDAFSPQAAQKPFRACQSINERAWATTAASSGGSCANDLACLRHVWNTAKKAGEVEGDNPVSAYLSDKTLKSREVEAHLDHEQLGRLLDAAGAYQGRKLTGSLLRLAILCACHTGINQQNLLDLTWEQVDFDQGVLRIPDSKNGDPVTPSAAALEALWERRASTLYPVTTRAPARATP